MPLAPLVFLLLVLSGCSPPGLPGNHPPPLPLLSRSPHPALKGDLDAMLTTELHPYSLAAIKVISLASGATLYETNASLLLPAASLQKLFTAAAALSRLGPEHAMATSVALAPDHKTLVVTGCGDPLLETADLRLMAQDLAAKLPPDRHYALAGDTACFDDVYWGSGWMWDDEPGPEAMYLSALAVNGNTIGVTVSPGKTVTAPVEVETVPPTRYVTLENSGQTTPPGGPCTVSVSRAAGERENHIRVTGSLALNCPPISRRLTVWRPELYTLTLLAEQLQQAGITAEPLAMGLSPAGGTQVAAIQHPLREIVAVMLKHSDNLSAENMLKYLAHCKSGQQGTAAGGADEIKDYLRRKGIATDQLVIADGSGVSRYNLTNADAITRLLAAAHADQSTFPVFENALPVAGHDGALAGRMQGTPAAGRVKAKTGTMRGVAALAGYTTTADGEPLAFAIIVQNFAGPGQRVRDLLDRIAVRLTTFSAPPPGD